MTEIKSGLAFHCHHDKLYEFVFDYDKRVQYIQDAKSAGEQKLRLRLFQLIPKELVPGLGSPEWDAFDKAWEAYDKAREACEKAWDAYNKAREVYDKAREVYDKAREVYDKAREAYDKAREAYNKAGEAYDKAREVYDKARKAYDKAWEAYNKAWGERIKKIHSELCLGCPWDGITIFPERGG